MGRGTVVKAPDGARWRVRRRWLDRPLPSLRRRFQAGRDKDLEDEVLGNLPFFDWLDGWPGIVLSVAFILIVFVLLPLLGVALELIALIFILWSGLVGKLIFGRPWIVEAAPLGGGGEPVTVPVRGWRRASETATRLAREIEAAGRPERCVGPGGS
jgi:hypothetical protein